MGHLGRCPRLGCRRAVGPKEPRLFRGYSASKLGLSRVEDSLEGLDYTRRSSFRGATIGYGVTTYLNARQYIHLGS